MTQRDGGGGGCFQIGWLGVGGGLPRGGDTQAETSVTEMSQPWKSLGKEHLRQRVPRVPRSRGPEIGVSRACWRHPGRSSGWAEDEGEDRRKQRASSGQAGERGPDQPVTPCPVHCKYREAL